MACVEPSEVVFDAVLPELVYAQNVMIRNHDTVARRVRIDPPTTNGPFTLIHTPSKALAPGLDVVIEVQFQLPLTMENVLEDDAKAGVYRDRLIVHFGDSGKIVHVPLRACEPLPKLRLTSLVPVKRFENVFGLDLGDVLLGTDLRTTITLENLGPSKAEFRFDAASGEEEEKNDLQFIPPEGSLGADATAYDDLVAMVRPHLKEEQDAFDDLEVRAARDLPQKATVDVIFTAKVLGTAHFHITTNANEPTPPVIELTANVVAPTFELRSCDDENNHLLGNVDFGSLFYGQTREKSAILVNESPVALPFVIGVSIDRDVATEAARNAAEASGRPHTTEFFLDEWQVDDGSVTVSPLEGLLEPYAKQKVIFKFAPKKPPAKFKFKHQIIQDEQDQYARAVGGPVQTAQHPEDDHDDQKGRRVMTRPYGTLVTVSSTGDDQTVETKMIDVKVSGLAACASAIRLTPRTLRFGTCEVRSRQKALVTIHNDCDVPAKFDFAKVAHFTVQPSRGKISGNATTTVVVLHSPGQIGSFDAKCKFTVESGLSTSFLRLIGKAQQTNQVAEASRFVDGNGSAQSVGKYQAMLADL